MKTRLKALMMDDDGDDKAADTAAAVEDISRWEPLTLAALLDYKTHLTAPGHGEFALGHVRLWPVR